MSEYTMTLQEVIQSGANIFDFEYPLVITGTTETDNAKKQNLEDLFTRRNYLKEIGQETISMFKYYLKERWLYLLPRYTMLWKAYNNNIEIMQDFSNVQSSKVVIKDTPINQLDEDEDYTSAIQLNDNTNLGQTKSDIDLIDNYRQKIKNIDELFIQEFDSLFMGIF